jgi:hypothetical protein
VIYRRVLILVLLPLVGVSCGAARSCDDQATAMSCVLLCAGAEGTRQGVCVCEPYGREAGTQ